MANYWAKRIQVAQNNLYDKGVAQTQKQLRRYYKQAAEDTAADIANLYDKLIKEAVDGQIKPNDLYRYNRYYELLNTLNQQLTKLGQEEIKLDNQALESVYNTTKQYIGENITGTQNITGNFGVPNNRAEQVINQVWCADGKSWSTRIWGNKEQLQQQLEKGMVDCVSRGVPKDEFVKMVKQTYSVDFNRADRIVRTELTHVQNQAAADSYKEADVENYEYLATEDERTSDECRELNGKIFRLDEMRVGVNAPPLHANCRCTIVPILNKK